MKCMKGSQINTLHSTQHRVVYKRVGVDGTNMSFFLATTKKSIMPDDGNYKVANIANDYLID